MRSVTAWWSAISNDSICSICFCGQVLCIKIERFQVETGLDEPCLAINKTTKNPRRAHIINCVCQAEKLKPSLQNLNKWFIKSLCMQVVQALELEEGMVPMADLAFWADDSIAYAFCGMEPRLWIHKLKSAGMCHMVSAVWCIGSGILEKHWMAELLLPWATACGQMMRSHLAHG